jgi:hypothetical protein
MKPARYLVGVLMVFAASAAEAQSGTNVTNANNGIPYVFPVYTGSSTLGDSPMNLVGNFVGIDLGLGTPSAPLEVNGNAKIDGFLGIDLGTGSPGHSLQVNGDAEVDGDLLLGDISGSNWTITTDTNHVLSFDDSQGISHLTLCDTGAGCAGRVGIGTSNPGAGLDVELNTDPTTGGPAIGFKVSNTVNVGSTTDSPQNLLQTSYSGSATQTNLYGSANKAIQTGTGAITTAQAGYFQVQNTNAATSSTITTAYVINAAAPVTTGPITSLYGVHIGAQKTSNVATAYGIYQAGGSDVNYFAGKIGIGVTAPTALLEVNGVAQVDGALNIGNAGIVFPNGGGTQTVAYTGVTCGGDYAESVDVSGDRIKYEPGDVLVIDPDNSGKFLRSAEPYSTAVTGIYSTKPGTVGRRQTTPKSPDEVPMAMVGIVPTKVSAENGPIHRGDLLVSSSTIGYAMKGTDRSRLTGAVIGKALSELESGNGVIEVVVTLQ